MMLYITSNTRPDIYSSVNQFMWFTHNTNSSHEISVKRICCYLQSINDNILVFNLSKIMVMHFYVDADFAGL